MRLTPLAAFLLLACTPLPEGEAPVYPSDSTGLRDPHGEIGAFFTPWAPFDGRPTRLLRWAFSRNPYDKSADPVVAVAANDGASLAGTQSSAELTWIGHASFAIHDGDDVVLTDPHFGKRALIRARVSEPGIPIEAIPPDAFAVISHSHYDHLDAYTVDTLPSSVQWFVPLGLGDWFRERDRPNVVELDWWQTAERGRWKITCLPSQHWSRRFGMGTNESLWCAWLLESGEYRYFFAGDTGYFHGFAEFGRSFGPIDVALLPIGAYEPRWFMRPQHMNPRESYRAFLDLGARHMVGMHWGTFDLTDEPVDLAPKRLAEVVAEAGGDPRVRVMAVGERWHVPPSE